MLSILNRALSWAITSFGNKFCLKKRSRLIKALDNRFYAKFMQLEIGLLSTNRDGKENEKENVDSSYSKVVPIIKCTCTVFIDNFRNISTNLSI